MTISEQREKTAFAAHIVAHESVDDIFVLTQAQQFQAKNGPFWRLTLQDASGQIEGKVWSPLAQEFSEFAINTFYAVSGRSSLYKDKVELSIASIAPLDQKAVDGLDLGDFVAVSPYPLQEMLDALKGLCAQHISHPPLVRFFALLFGDDTFVAKFMKAPAAKAMHHAYAGGLLEHTLSICRLCMSIADNYPTIDRQILLTGAVCHDLGKIWELSSGVSIDYTDEGRLVGHISLGLERITPYMQQAGLEPEHIMHIQHLILSHHGSYEFGAARLPSTAEAFVLHFADNIDAKLQQVSQALGDEPEGPHWSGFVRGLDRQVYKSPLLPQGSDSESLRSFFADTSGLVASTRGIDAVSSSELLEKRGKDLGYNDSMKEPEEDVTLVSAEPHFSNDECVFDDSVSMDIESVALDFSELDEGYIEALAHEAEQVLQEDAESVEKELWVAEQDTSSHDASFSVSLASVGSESAVLSSYDHEAEPSVAETVADKSASRSAENIPVESTPPHDYAVPDLAHEKSGGETISSEEGAHTAPDTCSKEVSSGEEPVGEYNQPPLEKKEKTSSSPKQSSLPLLEQCSLLLKE